MKAHTRFVHLLALLTVALTQRTWGAEVPPGAPARVGDVGAPARLSIEGVRTFTEGDIRRALRSDLDYLVASHSEATLAEGLAALEDRVRAGCRDCGFREVAVRARFDVSAGRIVAKVTEGPRFRCGALQVTGLKSIPVADFTRRFAEKLTPASDQTTPAPGTWKSAAPVSFTPDSLASYSAAASNTFAALGRFAATFKVEIQPQPASSDAALAVIVADEGPAAVLRDIEVVGNKQNRRDAVIGFLGLSKGMEVTQDLIDEKARALTQIARFADSSITPTTLGPDGRVSLHIEVVENGRLPPLEQTLSREERTLLRLREWLVAWGISPGRSHR
jgi:outer membrane protein assembly factor BamA